MNLIIAGKSDLAVDVLEHALNKKNINIYVVLNKTEDFKNSFQKSLGFYSKLWNVDIISLEQAYELKNAVFLSLEYDKLIKPKLFKSNHLFNIHFSKLPEYKGQYTSSWPILNNEIESGVTLHLIDDGIDTGATIDQVIFPLEHNETARSLYQKYVENGTELVIKNLENLLKKNFISTPQEYINSSFYGISSINYSNLSIDYNKTAFQIDLQLRAFSFREYQLPKFNDYEIENSKILETKSLKKPGSLIKEDYGHFYVSTVDYDILLFKSFYENLWEYCKLNNFIELKELLSKVNLDLETKTKEGWNALIISVYNNSIECVKLLLDHNVNINAKNYNDTTVLMYAKENALKKNNTILLDLILENGANLLDKDIYGKTVLDWLSKENIQLYNYLKIND
jgi:methionyl-tRNA formyltransferase